MGSRMIEGRTVVTVYNDDIDRYEIYIDGQLIGGADTSSEASKLASAYIMAQSKQPPETIQIKYFSDKVPRIEKLAVGDWIDLSTSEDVKMKMFEHKLIPLGVAMKLPAGYEAHVAPRSSTFRRYGIIQANSIGIIDNSYCGDNDQWMLSAVALKDGVDIPAGSRICQFRIVKKQPEVEFIQVEKLESPDRGGFGSTGR